MCRRSSEAGSQAHTHTAPSLKACQGALAPSPHRPRTRGEPPLPHKGWAGASRCQCAAPLHRWRSGVSGEGVWDLKPVPPPSLPWRRRSLSPEGRGREAFLLIHGSSDNDIGCYGSPFSRAFLPFTQNAQGRSQTDLGDILSDPCSFLSGPQAFSGPPLVWLLAALPLGHQPSSGLSLVQPPSLCSPCCQPTLSPAPQARLTLKKHDKSCLIFCLKFL